MRRSQLLALLAVLFVPVELLAQTTIHVPADQPSIQAGINAANNGDTVLVAAGTYLENINFNGKSITVQSASGRNVTIIDGQHRSSVVTFSANEGLGSVLDGFTIQNGGTSPYGGGIYISYASPTIRDNNITNNLSGNGSGIYVAAGAPVIEGNLISNNGPSPYVSGATGGGIAVFEFNGSLLAPQILGNTITGNTSSGGGGIYFSGSAGIIANNFILNNVVNGSSSPQGGGIYLDGSATVLNNVIAGNSNQTVVGAGGQGGGIYYLGPGSNSTSSGTTSFLNNTIVENDSPQGSALVVIAYNDQSQSIIANNILSAKLGELAVYCTANTTGAALPALVYNDAYALGGTAYGGNCSNLTGTKGNISSDPIFVNAGNGNYQLSFGSPAINAGDNAVAGLPSLDIVGSPRIADDYNNGDAVVDLGAYEMPSLPPAPTMNPSAASLDFGTITVGITSAVQTLTVGNSGPGGLYIRAATATAPFTMSSNNCLSTVAPSQNCTIGLTFAPSVPGAASGSLTLNSNASSVPLAIELTGNGAAQAFRLSASSLSFGNVWLGSSASQNLNVTNIGASAVPVVVTSSSAAFTWTSNCPVSLPASQTCTLTVTLSPTGLTTFNGTLTITDNAYSEQLIGLTGNGVGAELAIGPSNQYDFGSWQIGATPYTNFNIVNNGNAALTLISIGISTGEFSITNSTCGTSVAAGSYCSIRVQFTPATLGPASATITIVDNAPGSPHTISVTGTVVGTPGISIAPNPIAFGDVLVNSSSQLTVTITSSGTGSLKVNGISNTGPFSLSGTCAYTYLPSQSTCSMTLIFTPTTAGPVSGMLSVSNNAAGSPQTINISANAVVGPRIGFSSNPVTFGNVMVSSSSSVLLTISNTGNDVLAISSIAASGPFSLIGSCPGSLAPQGTCALTLVFAPNSVGSATGSLAVSDNFPGSPHIVSISGAGVDFAMLASPSSQKIGAGKAATYTVVLTPLGGFTGVVQLSCSGAPTGVSCTVPSSINVNGGVSPTFTATLTSSKTLKTRGTYPLAIVGTAYGVQHAASVSLSTKP